MSRSDVYKLRPYQQEAVNSVVKHFKKTRDPAVIVLPTGSGKSLVIAELAKIARGRVLALAHVKELVEQNHEKYEKYQLKAGIYSAGMNRKDSEEKVLFGSIQSVARAKASFFQSFSLLVIDECHRVSLDGKSQYFKVIKKLREINSQICILGLTATPYRLGLGWIYQYNHKGYLNTLEARLFKKCIFDLSLMFMIKNKYLTLPIKIDAPVACYDFSSLKRESATESFSKKNIDKLLKEQTRITPGIINHIVTMAEGRQGVMIFTSTVRHAKEILGLLPEEHSNLIIGETEQPQRDEIIQKFKEKKIKFLVNVSVLTTGFDAPHVDLIALLRPTESVSLYQQIIGRGLRLAPDKKDCLILDYTGSMFNIFSPEIGQEKPRSDSEVVVVPCPECGYDNNFWGQKDEDGYVAEHFGRKCQGAHEDPVTLEVEACAYRFRFKVCNACGSEADIAARECPECKAMIVDTDTKLKKAMSLKDAHIMKPDSMIFESSFDKKKKPRLKISYYDLDANALHEYYYLDTYSNKSAFYYNFIRMHQKNPGTKIKVESIEEAVQMKDLFRLPLYVIAHKKTYFWAIREKIF